MGNVISTRAWPMAPSNTADTQSMLPYDPANKQGVMAPLFLDEIEPETAPWSQESRCATIQRFFGWLPDSTAELLKQDQRAPQYQPGVISIRAVRVPTTRTEALMYVQRWYRRFRARRMWYLVSAQVLEIARQQLEDKALTADEEEMLLNFRQILASGFSAQKVSITGALKNIQLQLVLKAEQEECYLMWTPSRKRQPRIHLCDIQEVVPVSKEGNKHAPRLANKVSHRRGLIIVCKSHHRGRVVLQVSSKRERKVLLLGFQKLLDELNGFDPQLDDEGAMRKRSPRRVSAIKFFESDQSPVSESDRTGNDDKHSSSTSGVVNHEEAPVSETQSATLPLSPPAKVARRLSKNSALLYQTRYDESFPGADGTAKPTQTAAAKPAFVRRSSLVV